MELDYKLINKFKELNDFLKREYDGKLDLQTTRELISAVGKIESIQQGNQGALTLMGVDGSYNSYGANYRHQVWVFRGLAKGTNQIGCFNHDILTPLDTTLRQKIEVLGREKRLSSFDVANLLIKQKLAEIELDVAIEGIDKVNPDVVFMDGSLIRYKIEHEEKWETLRQLAITKDITLVGIIEEIGTKNLGKYLNSPMYDREILFGLLKKGEKLTLDSQVREGFITTYIRPGEDPQPIAIDSLEGQESSLERVITLATELTPEKGRGIPVWIDMVDHEVRITNKLIEGLAQEYLSPDIRHKFLMGKRKERWY